MSSNYVPERQDVVWVDFQPSKLNEIRGRHPAVVLSNSGYSRLTGLVAVSPITHAVNNKLQELFIPIKTNFDIEGYINPLQFHTFSIKGRNVQFAGGLIDDATFAEVAIRHEQIVSQ
jgi:mRNA interferase MazF